MKVEATLTVNGVPYPVELEPGTSLLAAVRDVVGLTGAKEGCDDSECGACMMLLDGRPVNSCSYLALQAEGSEVTTVEGLADGDQLSPLQTAFLEHGGVQCGFCTPGMLISATALLAARPRSATVVRRRTTSSIVVAHSSVTAKLACAAMSGPPGWRRSRSAGLSRAGCTTCAAREP